MAMKTEYIIEQHIWIALVDWSPLSETLLECALEKLERQTN